MKKFHVKFYENRKIYFTISLAIILAGVIFNVIFGTALDIQFKGGAMINYTYSGEIDQSVVESKVEEVTGQNVDVRIYENMNQDAEAAKNSVSISFTGSQSISIDVQKQIAEALTKEYPDAGFAVSRSNSVDPTMGQSFFAKCLVAIAITFVLLIIYVGFRFRKIGGTSAGVMAIVALLHDVSIVYFVFVIFQIPINDSFIAVVLTILGYSLNNTIIIYDRVRENRRLLGPKASYSELVNTSINQTLTRSTYTTLCTFVAITSVFIVGMIFNISSVMTFALPMMVGVVAGCYSSVCLAGPLYVMWQNHKQKKRLEAGAKA